MNQIEQDIDSAPDMREAETARYFTSGDGLKLFYHDFAPESAGTPIICLPGLTRNSRDFRDLALRLSRYKRVLTPDLRGRGYSEWDTEWRNYHPGTYVTDVWTLLDSLQIGKVIVIGTSLGGLIAMRMAFQQPQKLAGVIINDIGPEIAASGLARIKAYTGKLPSVENWEEAIAQTREIYGPWLPGLEDDEWRKLAWRAYRKADNGKPVLDMDPRIGDAIREAGPQTGDPWQMFEALETIPTLVLRGALSDILAPETLQEMQRRKPDLQSAEISDRGHVPLLNEPVAADAIDAFTRRL